MNISFYMVPTRGLMAFTDRLKTFRDRVCFDLVFSQFDKTYKLVYSYIGPKYTLVKLIIWLLLFFIYFFEISVKHIL